MPKKQLPDNPNPIYQPLLAAHIEATARNAALKIVECCNKVEKQQKKFGHLAKRAKRAERKINDLVRQGILNQSNAIGFLMFFKRYFFDLQQITPDAEKIRELEKMLKEIKKD